MDVIYECSQTQKKSKWYFLSRPLGTKIPFTKGKVIPNGCLDAYEVKVNIDIFKYQENVKLVSQFQIFFFQWLIRVCFIPIKLL